MTVRRPLRVLLAAMTGVIALLLLGLAGTDRAHAATDYTQGVSPTGAGAVQIWFTPTTPAALVDVHYLPSGGAGQQNFRMGSSGGTWKQDVGGLTAGWRLEYWFTYEKGGPLYDTGHFTYTVGSGATIGGSTGSTTGGSTGSTTGGTTAGGSTGGGGGGGAGTFPITFQNNTRGVYADSQVYVTVLGQVTPGQWSYLKPDGSTPHISHADATAPGHLTKNGVNYPNMSFTLAQARTVPSPASIRGGRIYVSIGSPVFIPVSADDQGWGGPDLRNPADPNSDVYYDWYEYTYVSGQVAFGGNTTQVDEFGFPMTAHLQQTSSGYDATVGITQTRAQVMSAYTASVGPAFRPLANTYRIVAPRSSGVFQSGGAQAGYLQPYIDQTWAYYAAHPFTLTRLGETFTGHAAGNALTFTKNGAGPFTLNKPTSADVFACAGALAAGSDTEKQLGAEFCAALNRGVAMDTSTWYAPAAYYTGAVKNDYAGFFHTVGLGKRAYGFPYDDINDQSSVQILNNANPPTSLTVGIGW